MSELAFGIDEWGAIPAYIIGLFGMVGATASYGGYGLSTVVASNLLGQSWTVAGVLALGGVAIGIVAYGWVDMVSSGNYATEELASLSIAAAVPLAIIFMPSVASAVTGSVLYGVGAVVVGGAGLAFATVLLDSDQDVPILGQALGGN